MVLSVARVSSTARLAMVAAVVTWRPISVIEVLSSSDAAATVCTLTEASSEAPATVLTWRLLRSAVRDMLSEVARICSDAVPSADSASPTWPSKAAM